MNDDVLSWIFDHSWGTGTPPQSRNWGQQVGMELVFSSTKPLIVLIRPPSAFNSIQETHLFSSHSFSTLRCILNQNLDSILAFQTLLHIFNIVLLFLTWITKDVNNISQAFYNDLLLEPATWGEKNFYKHFQVFSSLAVSCLILGWIRIILGGKELGKPGLKTSSRCSGLCAQSPPSHKNHFKTQGSSTTKPFGIFLFAATELWSAMIRMTVNEVITLTLVRSTLMSSAESVHSSVPVSKLGRNPILKCTCHV